MYNKDMIKQEKIEDILLEALKKEETIVKKEVINATSMKFLGSNSTDLYLFTQKNFVSKILKTNILNIKDAVLKIEKKNIRNIYLNNKLVSTFKLKELSSKKSIDTIDMESLKNRNNDLSNETNIIESIFSYETLAINKKKIELKFFNKFLSKEYTIEIKTSLIKGIISFFPRKKLIKKIGKLLELKYEPSTNDTIEILKLLHIV